MKPQVSSFLSPLNFAANAVAFAPQEFGLCIASGCADGSIAIHKWAGSERNEWNVTKIDNAHAHGVTAVSWAPGSDSTQQLASSGCDQHVRVWK